MNFTIPSITINIPTTAISNTLNKLRTLRSPKLPELPHIQAMHLLNLQLEDRILDKHSAHVTQARYHFLSQTHDISKLSSLQF